MFCGKCGTKNDDDSRFCIECGNPIGGAQPVPGGSYAPAGGYSQKRSVNVLAVIIAVAALLGMSIVGCLCLFVFGGRGNDYEDVVNQYIEASFTADAEAIFDLLPKDVIEYAMEEEGIDEDELDELIDELDEELEDQLSAIEWYLGDDWDLTYEIYWSEDLVGYELEDVQEMYEEVNVEVTAARVVEVNFLLESANFEISNSMDVCLIQAGRTWYLDAASMGGFF